MKQSFQEAALSGAPISVWLGYPHEGIPLLDGSVIHASKVHRSVVRTTLLEFTEGRPITVLRELAVSQPHVVHQRALAHLGKPYDLINANCQQFVRMCQGLPIESPAVQRAAAVTVAASVALVARNPYVTLVASLASAGALVSHEKPLQGALVGTGIGFFLALALSL